MHTIVIVGGGFSGAVTAVQLLRQARSPLRVVLVNASGRMARGLAYGTRSADHVLNVPAGNMGALAESSHDFLDYCRWANPAVQPQDFVSRQLYGAYLDALLGAAEAGGGVAPGVVLERVVGEVQDIACPGEPAGGPVRVLLAGGAEVLCQQVVLAFGHFLPAAVLPDPAVVLLGPRYLADPWSAEALSRLPVDGAVLLVGAGLTALDVLTSLQRQGHRGPVVCLSRHGLLPHGHRPDGARPGKVDGAALLAAMGPALRQQVRVLRRALCQADADGEDWRDVVGALRPHTPAWWQALGPEDRRRFLRHLRPWWDVLRHRCAPQALAVLEGMRASGQLRLLAGRLLGAELLPDGRVLAHIGQRGARGVQAQPFDLVVNCTGPSSDLRRCASPLVQRLLGRGLLQPDPLGLGLVVDGQYRVVDRKGHAQAALRYVGPMLKARDWEAVAVPELRVHARQLATDLLRSS